MSIDLLNSIHHIVVQIKKREMDKLINDQPYDIMTLVDANTVLRIIEESKQNNNGNQR